MKTSKRLLTLLLALVMLVGVFTVGAAADEASEPVTSAYNFSVSGVGVRTVVDGEYISFYFTVPNSDNKGEFLGWALTPNGTPTFSAVDQTLTLAQFAGIVGKDSGSVTLYPVWAEEEKPESVPSIPLFPANPKDEQDDYPWPGEEPEDFWQDNKPSYKPDCNKPGYKPSYSKEYNLYIGIIIDGYYGGSKYDCNHKYDCSCKVYSLTDSKWFSTSSVWDDYYYDYDGDYYGEFKAGEKVHILAPTPKASNGVSYRFTGWKNASYNSKNVSFGDKKAKYTTITMPAADTTVYAVYEIVGSNSCYYGTCNSRHTHTVTYTDGVKGETVFRDVVKNVRHNATTPTIKNPTREGYIFAGWSPKVATKTTECVTYEAKWISEDAPSLTTEHVAYMKGYGKGYFRPEGNVTRAEFATMLYRLMDAKSTKEYYSSTNTFADVGSDDWFNDAVSTLANAGVIKVANGEKYQPNKAITRAEVVAMLTAFYQTGKEYTCKFKDVPTNHAYYDEIAQAVSMGWIKGCGGNTFNPDATITRAEVAVIMNRVLDRGCSTKDTKNFVDNPTSAWFYQDVVEATVAH